jgi:hypothetical protein
MLEPERQAIETRIKTACWTLTTSWPRMLPSAPKSTQWGTVGRTDSRPLVIPVHTLDTRRAALARLVGWATVIVKGRGLSPRIDVNDAPGLARLVDAHAQWLSQQAGEVAADELNDSARKCSAIAWPDRPEEQFVGGCSCGARVYAGRGAVSVQCKGCKRSLMVDQVRATTEERVADYLASAAEISSLLKETHGRAVTPSMIRGYAARGRIAQHGTTVNLRGRTVPLYRIGDVVAAVQAAAVDPEERRATRRSANAQMSYASAERVK